MGEPIASGTNNIRKKIKELNKNFRELQGDDDFIK